MIIAGMVYAVIIGLLLTGAALAAEAVAKALKLPTRPVWSAALLITALWPIVANFCITAVERVPTKAISPLGPAFTSSFERFTSRILMSDVGRVFGVILLILWVGSSLALVGRVLWGVWQLNRRRQSLLRVEMDGVSVRVSSDLGPAVVGIGTMEVVLPEWVFAFDASLRRLIVRHEQEHCAAGDPRLLLLATLVVALIPWNVALWWQLQRLRLAIEVDCDDRVLSLHPQRERYGLLLLALVQRKTSIPTPCAPALVESTSHLERRIIAMRNRTRPTSRRRVLVVGTVAATMVTLACAVESSTRPLMDRAASLNTSNTTQEVGISIEMISMPNAQGVGTARIHGFLRAEGTRD